jgi:hypothetical protein
LAVFANWLYGSESAENFPCDVKFSIGDILDMLSGEFLLQAPATFCTAVKQSTALYCCYAAAVTLTNP